MKMDDVSKINFSEFFEKPLLYSHVGMMQLKINLSVNSTAVVRQIYKILSVFVSCCAFLLGNPNMALKQLKLWEQESVKRETMSVK